MHQLRKTEREHKKEGNGLSLLPVPMGVYRHVTALNPKQLREKNIKLVLADLDNTLTAYKITEPTPDIIAWSGRLKEEGIDLFILSNSHKPGRVSAFAQALDIPFQGKSGKPGKAGFLRAMDAMGRTPEETIIVGDQIFTDILGGIRAGITPILVLPVQLAGNPGRYIRYAIETPFRLAGRRRPFL